MHAWKWLAAFATVLALGACGGSGAGDGSGGANGTATPAALSQDGGKVELSGIATVVVPPGALDTDTTIRVAHDGTGAPPIPDLFKPVGPMVAITPHGATFAEPVTVRLPVPAVTLKDNERLMIAKAQPGGEWEVLAETVQRDGQLEVEVRSFSIFVPVVVPFTVTAGSVLPSQPYSASIALTCDDGPCTNQLVGSISVGITAAGNGGYFPANCVNPVTKVERSPNGGWVEVSHFLEATGIYRQTASLYPPPSAFTTGHVPYRVRLVCTNAADNSQSSVVLNQAGIYYQRVPSDRGYPLVAQFPLTKAVAEGATDSVSAVFTRGASYRQGNSFFVGPTAADQAQVFFERLAPGETAWRSVTSRTQTQANPNPIHSNDWAYWGFDFPIGPVTLAENGANYRVRACYGNSTLPMQCTISSSMLLTVLQHTEAPVVTQQPFSTTVQAGQTANLSALVSGVPAAALQWQSRQGHSFLLWNDVSNPGGNQANYTTPVLNLADDGIQFRLVATNSAGTTTSDVVTVFVRAGAVAPSINTQPQSIAVAAGSEALFAVNAAGTEALSYQWFRGGNAITAANSPQLRIGAASAADAGDYTVRVSNTAGSVVSQTATLSITAVQSPVAPSIVTQPAALTVTEGNGATFGVGATGSAPLNFQWQRNGVDIPGATAPTITLPAVDAGQSGTYALRVSNAAGTALSQAAMLTVLAAAGAPTAPSIVTQPSGVVVAPGMSATLAVSATGTGPFSYQWQRDGQPLAGQTGPVLTLASASFLDAGTYRVQVSNATGSATSAGAQLLLLGTPVINTPPAAVTATEGQAATFTVAATGNALHYQWLRNGSAIPGAEAASYTTPALVRADSGAVYGVIVYNGAGLLFSPGATLQVNATSAAYEGFDYPLGDLLQGKNGGTGWSGAWAVTANNGAALTNAAQSGQIATGLRYRDSAGNDLVTSGGAWQTSSGISAGIATRLTLATLGAPGTTRWISFLVKQAAVAAPPNMAAVTLGVDAAAGPLRTMAGISDDGSAHVGGLFNRTSNGTNAGFVPGSVAMVLVRVDFGVSGAYDDTMSLWLNPPLDPAVALGAPLASFPSANFADAFNGLAFIWGYDRSFTFDELRLGATRDVVSPYTPPAGNGTLVFTTDFATMPAEMSPGTAAIEASQGYAALPIGGGATWGSQMLRSATGNVVTLTLTGLPAHQWLSLDFLFAAIDSLDGAGTYPAGDYFRITVDGVDVFREAFENSDASGPQTYLPPPGVQLARKVDLGFSGPGGWYTDSAYWMGGEPSLQRIPHSASSATITMRIEGVGNQSLDDESWGLGKLRVRAGP